jgi:hypothetical protein
VQTHPRILAADLQPFSGLVRSLPEQLARRSMCADRTLNRTGATRMPYRRGSFALTPPSFVIFAIALVLALVAMLAHYMHASVPLLSAAHAFDALAIAFVVLTIGVLFRGV